jgi:hypothetical protein
MRRLGKLKLYAVIGLLAFALGSLVANETGTRAERPFLRFFSTAARWGLRALVFLEPAPPEIEQRYQTSVGSDGFEVLDHSRSL